MEMTSLLKSVVNIMVYVSDPVTYLDYLSFNVNGSTGPVWFTIPSLTSAVRFIPLREDVDSRTSTTLRLCTL